MFCFQLSVSIPRALPVSHLYRTAGKQRVHIPRGWAGGCCVWSNAHHGLGHVHCRQGPGKDRTPGMFTMKPFNHEIETLQGIRLSSFVAMLLGVSMAARSYSKRGGNCWCKSLGCLFLHRLSLRLHDFVCGGWSCFLNRPFISPELLT